MFKEKLLSRYRQISFPTNTKISGINSCSQLLSHVNADELGCLFEVDFASFLAHVEEEEARRKSKDDDCEKDLGKLTEQEDGNLTRMVVESLKHEK
jgi:hypothetical protein